MKLVPDDIMTFLEFDDIITKNTAIVEKTQLVTEACFGQKQKAEALFNWVRDVIPHAKDVSCEVVTCNSDHVLEEGTGICFAKIHLLASMMRVVGIPCGLCYQVFENESNLDSSVHSLHGLNAIYLDVTKSWHRIDPRGNEGEVNAQFSIENESLAFPEMEFLDDCIYAKPLDNVVHALRSVTTIANLWPVLPSVKK